MAAQESVPPAPPLLASGNNLTNDELNSLKTLVSSITTNNPQISATISRRTITKPPVRSWLAKDEERIQYYHNKVLVTRESLSTIQTDAIIHLIRREAIANLPADDLLKWSVRLQLECANFLCKNGFTLHKSLITNSYDLDNTSFIIHNFVNSNFPNIDFFHKSFTEAICNGGHLIGMKLGTGTEVCETLLSFLIEFVPSYAWGIDKIIIECDDNQQKWIESALDNQWTIQFAPKELPKLITASKETHTGPTNTSNWVIPGRLMAGAYPGSLNPGEHTKTVHSILKSKITTFVCLQEKEELGRFVPYKTIAKDHPNHVKFIHFPISDMNITDDESVLRLIIDLWWRLMFTDEVIYVHCWGGHGRTGTIIATLIGFLYQVDAEAALDHTAATHKMRNPARSSSPQTASQFEQVRRLIGQFATLVPPIAHLGWAPK